MNRAAMLARRKARKRDGARAVLVTFAMAAALAGPLALQHARRDACGLDLRIVFGPVGQP